MATYHFSYHFVTCYSFIVILLPFLVTCYRFCYHFVTIFGNMLSFLLPFCYHLYEHCPNNQEF